MPCLQALLLNETLHTLDLSCCRLGPSAALVLSQGVRRNTRLRRLICDANHLGEPGGRQLLGSLKYNHDLELLSLRGISFRDTVDTKVCITTHLNPITSFILKASSPFIHLPSPSRLTPHPRVHR